MNMTRTVPSIILAGWFILSFFPAKIIQAQQLSSYALDPRIWKGEINIVRMGSGENKKPHDTGWNYANSQVHDEATIHACGEAGELYVTKVERSISDTSESDYKGQARSVRCPPDDKLKKPGNSLVEKKQATMALYTGDDCPPLEPVSTVRLMVWPGGRYTLLAVAAGYASLTINEVSREKFVCTGDTKITEFHRGTCGILCKARTSAITTGEGNSTHYIQRSTQPPIMFPSGVPTFEGSVSGDSITDSTIVSEKKAYYGGSHSVKTTASWSFSATDPCDQVIHQLMNDLAYAEAYSSEEIKNFAGSLDAYESLVDENAYKRLFGKPSPRDSKPPSDVSMYVDPLTCKIKNKDEYKNRLKRLCVPNIIFNSTLKHEKTHVRQCKKFHEEFNMDDPNIHGLMEVTAHLAGIKSYLGWLEENCPSYDTADAKKRVEKLKANKFKRK